VIKLADLEVYKVAMEIGDIVWNIVNRWDFFSAIHWANNLPGRADSIAFNISEGYGRFHYAENKNFCYYSRGSAYETVTAINKSKARNLLSPEEIRYLKKKRIIILNLLILI